MPSFKKRWNAKQLKEAIRSMKHIIKLLESGQYELVKHGEWPGLDGKINLSISIQIIPDKE